MQLALDWIDFTYLYYILVFAKPEIYKIPNFFTWITLGRFKALNIKLSIYREYDCSVKRNEN